MANRPRLPVGAPRYESLRYGLEAIVQWVDDPDPHWENGVEFQPDTTLVAAATTDKCYGDAADKTPTKTGVVTRCADPFTLYAEIKCSPIGHWDDYLDRTIAALDNGQGRTLEAVFWTGIIAGSADVSPHLAEDTAGLNVECILQTAATVVTGAGGPVPWQSGVALLEDALADCYGGVGVIHMPLWAAGVMLAENYLIADGPRLRTRSGTLVAAGAGYPGTSPAGVAPATGSTWMYATGAVAGRKSVISAADRLESLDRAKNTMVMIAERTFVLAWDHCHLAVQVNMLSEEAAVVNVGSLTVAANIAATTGTAVQSNDTVVDATVGGVTLLAANANRKSALIQNVGAADARVTFDGTAPTVAHGHLVSAGGSLVLAQPYVPTAVVKAIRTGAVSTSFSVSEVV